MIGNLLYNNLVAINKPMVDVDKVFQLARGLGIGMIILSKKKMLHKAW